MTAILGDLPITSTGATADGLAGCKAKPPNGVEPSTPALRKGAMMQIFITEYLFRLVV